MPALVSVRVVDGHGRRATRRVRKDEGDVRPVARSEPDASWLIQSASPESPGERSRSSAKTGSETPYVPEAAVLYVRARRRSG